MQHKSVKLRKNWVEESERGEDEKMRMREEERKLAKGEKKVEERRAWTKKQRMRTAG